MRFLTKKNPNIVVIFLVCVLRLFSFSAIAPQKLSILFMSWSFIDPKDSQVSLFPWHASGYTIVLLQQLGEQSDRT